MSIEVEFLEDLISEGNLVRWKHKQKCTYMCGEEIHLICEKYNIKNGSKSLLYSLGHGVVNSLNIISDEDGNPLSQIEICKNFDLTQRTFARNISALIENKLIYSINIGKYIYYIMNPYLMYSGEICEWVVNLFDGIGYQRQCDFELNLSDSDIRWSKEYSDWRDSVREKYNYECIISGNKNKPTDKIKVHHLNGFNWDIENRFNINNGVCLSNSVHEEFHRIYGKGNNTREQFEEFYFNKTGKLFN